MTKYRIVCDYQWVVSAEVGQKRQGIALQVNRIGAVYYLLAVMG